MSEDLKKSNSVAPEIVNIDESNSLYAIKKDKLAALRSEPEKTKAWIVKALVIIFGSTMGCCFVFLAVGTIFSSGNREYLQDIITLVLVAEIGIVGTIIGFYFGDRSKS